MVKLFEKGAYLLHGTTLIPEEGAGQVAALTGKEVAYYDGAVYVDLSTVKPMMALPFHPSNTYEIDELNANLEDILHSVEVEAAKICGNPNIDFSLTDKIVDGRLQVSQGIIAGCAGGNYTNVMEAAHILKGKSCGSDAFSLAVYPSSQPVYMDLVKKGAIADLMSAGAVLKTAFCGPCFGAGDTPANNGLSIRHTTRNFPNREGSKPGVGQMAAVALMDARSIAAPELVAVFEKIRSIPGCEDIMPNETEIGSLNL